MSGLLSGGGNITNTESRFGSLRVQQSSEGVPIALLWGRNRVSPNLLWFDDFQTIESRTSQQAGKGGGTTVTSVNYTYRASLLMGLCAGICSDIVTIWRNKQKITASTRTLPADQLSQVAMVPVGKTVTVPTAERWATTVAVSVRTANADTGGVDLTPIADYTVTAGTYTLGTSVDVNTEIQIDYTLAAVVQTLSALQTAEFSAFGNGALGQPVWGYLAGAHPAQAIAYSGITYVAAHSLLLGAVAGVPQLSFEVNGPAQMGGGNPDANPADVLISLLTDPLYGANFPTASLDSMAAYRSWCNAAGLWVSPVWAERKGAFEYVNQLAKLTHSRPLWSVNVLKLVPMATESLASAGGNYTPAAEYSSAVYALNDDDFSGPVEETRAAPADRFNRVTVKYRNRATEYADTVVSAEDRASIDAFGLIEAPDVMEAHEVATAATAAVVAELLLREYMTEGSQYRFTLPISYDLLEPLDLVQIEDARIDLGPRAVRIIEINEAGEDGALHVLAEDVRSTGAVIQSRQASGGDVYDSGPPPAVSVRAVMMPTAATGNVQQLWLGVAADDNWGGSSVWVSATGVDYRRVADVNVRARMGTLAAGIASASTEVNPSQVLSVNMTGSTVLASVNQVDVDALRSLMWVNGELMAYRDAKLTDSARYDLGYLRRALFGSLSSAHGLGDPWLRLDDSLVKIDVPATDIGSTLFVKVTSRNALGTYVQGLEEVSSQQVVLTAQPSAPDAVQALVLTAPFVGTYFECNWQAATRASDYQVELRDLANNLLRTVYTSAQVFRYLYADAQADGVAKRSYQVKVRGRNTGGNGPWASLAVSNPAPPITTGVAATGSGNSRTINWAASAATDLAGYAARYSTTAGFSPEAGQGTGFYDGSATTAVLSSLTVGTTYYIRVAAFDVWDRNISALNWSAQYSFTA